MGRGFGIGWADTGVESWGWGVGRGCWDGEVWKGIGGGVC